MEAVAMSDLAFGLFMFAAMFGLIVLRFPIAIAMAVIGGIGYVEYNSFFALSQFVKSSVVGKTSNYTLSVIPLFILMGHFATKAGLSASLFEFARYWVGHIRGGIAMATIVACGAFGAISGSSLATGATMSRIALPEMRTSNYSPRLAGGALAAGGTLGILIPPSIILVIYAVIAEQSIGKLFMAAFVPGVMAVAFYIGVIAIFSRMYPELAPAGPRAGWRERLHSLWSIWIVIALFLTVVGGIYGGFFTPTEGASVGVVATLLIMAAKGKANLQNLLDSLLETGKTTGLIMLILVAAEVYNSFLAMNGLPQTLARTLGEYQLSPLLLLFGMLAIYLALGCVMDSISMILLTVPVFLPLVLSLDLGLSPEATAIWFGILALMVVEMGLITPPIGLNVFIIAASDPQTRIQDAFIGVIPFLLSDIVRVAILTFFPALVLWLPDLN
jgi:tripartite ATP-independent transporter DctM subunit